MRTSEGQQASNVLEVGPERPDREFGHVQRRTAKEGTARQEVRKKTQNWTLDTVRKDMKVADVREEDADEDS